MASGIRSKLYVVLLVEDNADLRAIYATALRESRFIVDEARTKREGLDMGACVRPDIIVLDRGLPDGDGWDVARALKADERTQHAPIIAFTCHRERADVEVALIAGCDAFLEKGCSPFTLVQHVRGMLNLPLEVEGAEGAAPPTARRA
jgi:DNA-binding response OmpR family regulator